ncbi:MAG: sulfatase-like hydrolase/transferase [Verrucomicrobiota bacterium]
MRTLLLAALSLWLAGLSLHAAARPPNIVFIFADDLGYGALGCYGQTKIKTPNIDRLAAEGMKFTQCYAGSHVCAPSRSVLMTGLHTGHTPVRANGKKRHLYDIDITVAEVLKKKGYATGGFGKWGLGDIDTPGVAIKQGFDEWFGQYHQVHAHFFYPYWVWHNDRKYMLPGNENGQRKQYVFDETHAKALDFIRRQKDRPFFAYLPYIIPHVELVVPEDSEKLYRGQFPKKSIPDPRKGYLGSEDAYATYAGMVSRLDRAVGEIMALLKDLKLDDNTAVFFSSDNGAQGATWRPLIDFFDGTGGLRGEKGNFYEGGIRDPLIVRWPGKVKPGTTSDHVCAFWDIMPTLAEIAGAEPPSNIDGISFVPTLLGKRQRKHEYLYWEYPAAKGFYQCIRMGDWKALQPRMGAPFELYNLKDDPKETTNLAAEKPDILAKLKELMAQAHTPERDYAEDPARPTYTDYVRVGPTGAQLEPSTLPRTQAEASAIGVRARPAGGIVVSIAANESTGGTHDMMAVAAVRERWNLLRGTRPDPQPFGRATVAFRLHADGRVSNVRMEENSLGDQYRSLCEDAVSTASFRSWPADLRRRLDKDHRDLRITFTWTETATGPRF